VRPACAQEQPHQGPWQRHTIDDTSDGADGVRLGDANHDGLMDIVTGWEEGGIVRLYINPGPEAARETWPAVTVGPARNVEDAVLVDLDGDGMLDVVSSCEGNTRTMYVHWSPSDAEDLLDPDAWVTEAIPATAGLQQWMYCLPLDVDRNGRTDLVVGSKNAGAAVGWLESPEDPRDLAAWQYRRICDAGWIMTLAPIPPLFQSQVNDPIGHILVSDRRGDTRGVYLLDTVEWEQRPLATGQAEYMFAWAGQSPPIGIAVATRDGELHLYPHPSAPFLDRSERSVVPNPFGIQWGKAVAIGRVDDDRTHDLVVTFNTQRQPDLPGVAWIHVDHDLPPDQWPAYDISGPEGAKFDRIELIDMDGDGDLDVLTCEEVDQLGVIWYENPLGRAE